MSQNINKLLKQAQKMQSQVMRAQQELAAKQVQGTAGGGAVTVTMNGAGDLVAIKLASEVVNPADIEMLEDLIVAACANAREKVAELSNSTLGSITNGMKIPGLS
jgi:nucleoid-associated protein EbfC